MESRWAHNPKVAGSNPAPATKYTKSMSILIVALPRTGSTMLCRILAEALDYEWVIEPFNTRTKRKGIDLSSITPETDVVVKTMIEQWPKDERYYDKHPELYSGDIPIDFNKFFMQRFKHTILLDRIDLYDQAISITNAQRMTQDKNIQHWHVPYRALIDDKAIDIQMDILQGYKNNLEILSNVTDIPITYYENVYNQSDVIRARQIKEIRNNYSKFNLNRYLELTHPSKRYRRTEEPKKLL